MDGARLLIMHDKGARCASTLIHLGQFTYVAHLSWQRTITSAQYGRRTPSEHALKAFNKW
jgi:hypothetical protein